MLRVNLGGALVVSDHLRPVTDLFLGAVIAHVRGIGILCQRLAVVLDGRVHVTTTQQHGRPVVVYAGVRRGRGGRTLELDDGSIKLAVAGQRPGQRGLQIGIVRGVEQSASVVPNRLVKLTLCRQQ